MNRRAFIIERPPQMAKVIINRPERRNAFSISMWNDLIDIVRDLESDPEVRVVVITGAGTTAFGAGADITEMQENYPPVKDGKRAHPVRTATGLLTRARKVYIAMVNGFAIGGGCELAVACDLRVAVDTAKLGITSAKMGICISFNDIQLLVGLVGPSRAKAILFSGRLVSAQEAVSMGLVDYVVPREDLEPFTMGLAQEIAENAPLSVLWAKKSINRAMGVDRDDGQGGPEIDWSETCFETWDFREGVKAFLEKRKPDFQGR